jgi:hypothetical protein
VTVGIPVVLVTVSIPVVLVTIGIPVVLVTIGIPVVGGGIYNFLSAMGIVMSNVVAMMPLSGMPPVHTVISAIMAIAVIVNAGTIAVLSTLLGVADISIYGIEIIHGARMRP